MSPSLPFSRSTLAAVLSLLIAAAPNAVHAQTTVVAAGSSGASSGAVAATSTLANSIDPSLPQTAPTGPQGFTIPSLSAFTSGAPTEATVALDTTYSGGAAATKVSGAPPLPTTAVSPANYPALDLTPPTNSPEVQGWLSQIDFSKVPSYNQTDGTCGGSPAATTDGRCWWTCGGCTRPTDITTCPDKYTWGLSYDDGPSPYTPLLLDYLNEKQITSTFFIVGSRAVTRPQMVQSEYMSGHQLSVHTWAHPYLTKLTNEQIVAELGWTKKIIKDIVGVTPNTFRPPYGDIDDRVRAIAAQMGLTPIIWSSATVNGTVVKFDTTDWNIPAGTATGESALGKFEQILNTYVPTLNTGFIVLEHDLFQSTVDLAVGYVLPMAIASGKFTLKSIISCLGKPLSEAYIETSSNVTTTRITAASSGTFYQASLGSATFAVSSASSAASSASSTSRSASSSSGSASSSGAVNAASASATTSKSSATRQFAAMSYWPATLSLVAVGAGMALVA